MIGNNYQLPRKNNVNLVGEISLEKLFCLVYRASFRQTFEEFTAPSGIWKYAFGWTLISLAGLTIAYDGWRRICMY